LQAYNLFYLFQVTAAKILDIPLVVTEQVNFARFNQLIRFTMGKKMSLTINEC